MIKNYSFVITCVLGITIVDSVNHYSYGKVNQNFVIYSYTT